MPIPVSCPLCNSPSDKQNVVTRHVYGGKADQAFYRCDNCDVCYLFPRLSAEEEKKFYAAEFSNFMRGRAGSSGGWEEPTRHVDANAGMVARRMKYMTDRLPRTGRVLEVGCSSGFMLYPLLERGLECVGIEPAGVFGDYVRSRGVDCYDSWEEMAGSGKYADGFELVLHGFVLEHISAPKAFLQQQIDVLKPGGQLIFELPNSADALVTIYDLPVFERFYWIVAHAWYFSQPSLEYLLRSLDQPFQIMLDQRYDLSNHIVWARDGRPGGMGRFTAKFGAELEDQYKKALIASGHCDTLIGVVTKRQAGTTA